MGNRALLISILFVSFACGHSSSQGLSPDSPGGGSPTLAQSDTLFQLSLEAEKDRYQVGELIHFRVSLYYQGSKTVYGAGDCAIYVNFLDAAGNVVYTNAPNCQEGHLWHVDILHPEIGLFELPLKSQDGNDLPPGNYIVQAIIPFGGPLASAPSCPDPLDCVGGPKASAGVPIRIDPATGPLPDEEQELANFLNGELFGVYARANKPFYASGEIALIDMAVLNTLDHGIIAAFDTECFMDYEIVSTQGFIETGTMSSIYPCPPTAVANLSMGYGSFLKSYAIPLAADLPAGTYILRAKIHLTGHIDLPSFMNPYPALVASQVDVPIRILN